MPWSSWPPPHKNEGFYTLFNIVSRAMRTLFFRAPRKSRTHKRYRGLRERFTCQIYIFVAASKAFRQVDTYPRCLISDGDISFDVYQHAKCFFIKNFTDHVARWTIGSKQDYTCFFFCRSCYYVPFRSYKVSFIKTYSQTLANNIAFRCRKLGMFRSYLQITLIRYQPWPKTSIVKDKLLENCILYLPFSIHFLQLSDHER